MQNQQVSAALRLSKSAGQRLTKPQSGANLLVLNATFFSRIKGGILLLVNSAAVPSGQGQTHHNLSRQSIADN